MIFTSNYFCTPKRLVDPFRGPSSLIFSGKHNYSGRGEKLTTDLYLMSTLRMVCRGISVRYFHLHIQVS